MTSKVKLLPLLFAAALFLGACSASAPSDETAGAQPALPDTAAPTGTGITVDVSSVDGTLPADDETQETDVTENLPSSEEASEDTGGYTEDAGDTVDTGDVSGVAGAKTGKAHTVVWLGDSLTQGSLGDNNDNLANAPYEKLKKMVSVPVEGYGLYGYNTHDIFWLYINEDHLNQKRDPDKTYVFWVGSNDWVVEGVPNTDTASVISSIDDFLTRNDVVIKDYIIIGTTARYELGDSYKVINAALSQHYGSHYLDVIDVIGPGGYGPDKIHLTQAAYDAVAKAVAAKLKSLGYI